MDMQCRIKVRFFARSQELVGKSSIDIAVAENQTVSDVLEILRSQYPNFAQIKTYMLAINQAYCQPNSVVKDGDELAIIPPVSGG